MTKVGVDLDNTIVCYDGVFQRVAVERGLIDEGAAATKGEVRDFLRRADREDDWTALQGFVYGSRMGAAKPFPGALDFFRFCRNAGIDVCIISHRTPQPYKGPPYDLHQSARDWLKANGFFDPEDIGMAPESVYLNATKKDKLEAIGLLGCTHFIDDLPEFLSEPGFPKGVERILFDPNDRCGDETAFRRILDWASAAEAISTMPGGAA